MAVLSLAVGAQAQSIFNTQARLKALTEENTRLQFQVDSLMAVLDSLEMERIEEEEVFMNGNGGFDAVDGTDSTIVEYTVEITDSLLNAWYENRRFTDYVEDVEYDMDSVAFTSSLSDEELLRRITAMNSYISVPFNATVKNYIVL